MLGKRERFLWVSRFLQKPNDPSGLWAWPMGRKYLLFTKILIRIFNSFTP